MDKSNDNRKLTDEFTRLMYSKGYRGKYRLLHPCTGHPGMMGTLNNCLEKFLTGYDLTGKTKDRFELKTFADGGNTVKCSFKIKFDEVKGFLIKEAQIVNVLSKENRLYRISHNQQLHGSTAIAGLFLKPKPWAMRLKGKFRP